MNIRGLTIWQPMAWAIKVGHKTIENRTWRPYNGISHLAIHAGSKYHQPHAEQMSELLGLDVPGRKDAAKGAIIAVAEIVSVIRESESPWFFGPFGWVLDDIQALETPIARQGSLGLWKLGELELKSVREQLPGLPWD